MATETGHAKNLANIDKLLDLVTQFGAVYNPVNSQLTLTGLKALKTLCTTDYGNWMAKFTIYKNETNAREIAFAPVDKLCTAISDSIKTLDLPQQTIDDVTALISKIHGSRRALKTAVAPPTGTSSTPPIVPTPNTSTTISTSQQSYDSIIANFAKLVSELQAITLYVPNETKLQTTSLSTLLGTLVTVNTNANKAINTINLARNQRNLSFYSTGNGLYDITKKVKLYVRQIYGSQSPEYRQATAIKFTKIAT